MKILFVNDYYRDGEQSGRSVHIREVFSRLIAAGHEVWTQQSSGLPGAKRLSLSRARRISQLLQMDVMYLRHEGCFLDLPRFMESRLAQWLISKPIIWEMNAAPDLWAIDKWGHGKGIELFCEERRVREQAKRVDLAICNTQGLADFARDLGIMERCVIPLGSDPRLFSPQVAPLFPRKGNEGELRLVWMGSSGIFWHDFEVVSRCMKRLESRTDIVLYVLGSWPDGVSRPANIQVIGLKPYREVPNYLASMDIGLACYRYGSWSRYGVFSSPLKMFDYAASGLAIVANPIEQVQGFVENGKSGFLFPFADDRTMAELIVSLANNRSLVKECGMRARKSVEDYFNWDRVAQETLKAIDLVTM